MKRVFPDELVEGDYILHFARKSSKVIYIGSFLYFDEREEEFPIRVLEYAKFRTSKNYSTNREPVRSIDVETHDDGLYQNGYRETGIYFKLSKSEVGIHIVADNL